MKKKLIPVLSLALTLGVSAQNKLDFPAQRMMESYLTSLKADSERDGAIAHSATNETVVSALVTIASSDDVQHLSDRGYDVIDVVGNIAMIDMPLGDVESLCKEDYVVHVSFGGEAVPMMDEGRATSGVDAVHQGADLKMPYTGKGIIVSLFDVGLDPNHINFMDQDGNTRVLGIDKVTGTGGSEARFTTPTQISNFTTDDNAETHGTHVLGIAAGSYNGDGQYAGTTGNIPYYGVAPDADIIVGCGDLYNNNILKGVKYITDCVGLLDQPAVINLSLGSNVGMHDNSSSFNKMLASYGEKAIIVISAGNEGDIPMGLRKVFSADDTELMTSIAPFSTVTGSVMASSNFTGSIGFYSNDKTSFKLYVGLANSRGTVSSKVEINGSMTVNSSNLPGIETSYGAGAYLSVRTNVDTSSQRYAADISFNLDTTKESLRSTLVFIIEGNSGQVINGYINGKGKGTNGYDVVGSFTSRGIEEWIDGTPDGSINDMACGDNTICIGSYNTRKSWKTISGGNAGYSSIVEGDISDFSSYGTLADGSTLPHITAPGCYLLSSWSRFNIENGYASSSSMVASVTQDGKTNYWGPMQGTSMSAPFAAGVFAIWLEADPTLTVEDIKSIAKTTAIRDSYVENGNPVRWGAGKLDALAGIKEVIRRADAGVDDILADSSASKLIVEALGGNRYSVFLAGGKNLSASLYSLSGAMAMQVNGDDSEVELDASALAPGVYVLDVTNGLTREATKIVVK